VKKYLAISIFSLTVFCNTVNAQSNVLEIEKEDEKDYLAAEDLFDDGKYSQAIPFYQKLEKNTQINHI